VQQGLQVSSLQELRDDTRGLVFVVDEDSLELDDVSVVGLGKVSKSKRRK
jgi:hypothetical protein